MYEWAEEQSRLSGRSVEAALRERLHVFYERRMAFDSAFTDGRSFRYGVLNAGGIGFAKYAPYCLVLTRTFLASLTRIAYLPGDSLELCFGATSTFDQTVVERQAAPHTHRHLMVASERASEVPAADKSDWCHLVASPARYFEAIFAHDVSLSDIGRIRVLKSEHDRLWDLAFGSFGRKLGDAERALVQDFVQLRRSVLGKKVVLEVLT